MVKCLTSMILAILLTLVVGIPITASTATIAVYAMCMFLIKEVATKIKEKKMPSVLEWVIYATVFVALILLEIGLYYLNVYVLIVGAIIIVIGLICAIIRHKKETASETA